MSIRVTSVSILVVLEVVPEDNVSRLADYLREVSILVVLEVVPEEQHPVSFGWRGHVSILVVLEVVPEVVRLRLKNFWKKRFNPCCSGSGSGSSKYRKSC